MLEGVGGLQHVRSATAERWSLATGHFSPAGALRPPRIDGTITRLVDGCVLVVGGGTVQSDVYDPVRDRWSATGDLHVAPWPYRDTAPRGRVLVAGGVIIGARRRARRCSRLEFRRPAASSATGLTVRRRLQRLCDELT